MAAIQPMLQIVTVDPDRPLRWAEDEGLTVGLTDPGGRLAAKRERLKELFEEAFGELPPLLPFDPNIVLGVFALGYEASPISIQDATPQNLWPNLPMPATLSMAGLAIAVNNVEGLPTRFR
jgi:hypothetical protein